MDKKSLFIGGVTVAVIQILLNTGIFVKFSDLYSYAVSKSEFQLVLNRLESIDGKLDNINAYLRDNN